MTNLLQKQCLNHPQREAAARCPECGHFYCRECITEHDDRVICSSCLKKLLRPEAQQRRSFSALARLAAFSLSLFTAWIAFYWVGRILLSIPASFHDGTIWTSTFWQE